MTTKEFLIVELHKDGSWGDTCLNDAKMFTDFDAAFEVFNELITPGLPQLRTPRSPQPQRAVLSDRIIELWIIQRADELVKA